MGRGYGVRRLLTVVLFGMAAQATAARADGADGGTRAPRSSSDRDWDLALFVGYGRRAVDGTLIINRSGPGSGIATTDSLGLRDSTDPQFALDGRWRRLRAGLLSAPTSVDGRGFGLSALQLGNVGIGFETPVSTDVDVRLNLFAIRYAVVENETTTLDAGVGLGKASLDINISPGLGQPIVTDSDTPFGFLTLELGQRLSSRWAMRFAARGAAIARSDNEIAYFDYDVDGAYRVRDGATKLDVVGGYRLINLMIDYLDQDSSLLVNVQLRGPYLGLRFAF